MSSDAFSNLLYASLSALVARTITHPLDTLKTRIQNSPSHSTYWRTATSILGSEHPSVFFRGIGVTLCFSVPGMSLYLATYDELKLRLGETELLGGSSSLWTHALAGAGAECISSVFWTPMEVLKTKLQMGVGATGASYDVLNEKRRSEGSRTLRLAKDIYQTFGMRGFYRGYLLSQAVFIPYTMIYFVTYEQFKQTWCRLFSTKSLTDDTSSNPDISFSGYLLCASTAGAVAGGVSNIMDVVKTRVQVTSAQSAWKVIHTLWTRERGPLAFTKGMWARILWVTPSMAISVTVYELFKEYFGKNSHD
ncbi:hypothetical protein BATDEDRAFT_25872 [Batrachochytrium dendrobatidis JAM81]|uniref:Mitochondrial carrier n=2 Tax=Batrachochytrium dendrobatidis TaxID=109871 RepID=F4P5V9_BATDJ|nr:uncharacterized protein BATDEDRAFT_25872 [Batrachochytrium dendrobatidis JAM81]EGF79248.1 hypothetical protein BATDEDRAFT_25872 [Batrachochytrium dendrobatidis JAM81]KAJ8322841.1 hypothetical protein O5D80_008371 [Batrachochytrium dendrobatidis]KAK5665841.1 hypothetical protein QVD99_007467 [Batrachochytrium dendrobatidis]OAJ42777.1 hypothetical protein BDEG_26190 [Batrachochytrium dendrobatidis JEL423]|eukprot:XP_006679901.1 hypothetical protein BATDEDRAFT_25872 [Batrachochytrium dendrobatidis JAM81]